MKEISGSREMAKIISGAHKVNLESSDKENLGSEEQRAKFLRERGAEDPQPLQSLKTKPKIDVPQGKWKIDDSLYYMDMHYMTMQTIVTPSYYSDFAYIRLPFHYFR